MHRFAWVLALSVLIAAASSAKAAQADTAVALPGNAKVPDRLAFACEFIKPLATEWRTIGGKWELKDGCLRMIDAGADDPTKAVLVMGDKSAPSFDVAITAKLRLDEWTDDDFARAGIGVCADPTSGHGINLVLHRGQLQFMHDYVAWSPGSPFRYRTGEWYWMKLWKSAKQIRGKVWREGDAEPADWMVAWDQFDAKVAGYPALVGCSAAPQNRPAAVSFAQFQVRVGDVPVGYYTKQATWHEAMAASREVLARQEIERA